jgi:hypothetical protein
MLRMMKVPARGEAIRLLLRSASLNECERLETQDDPRTGRLMSPSHSASRTTSGTIPAPKENGLSRAGPENELGPSKSGSTADGANSPLSSISDGYGSKCSGFTIAHICDIRT